MIDQKMYGGRIALGYEHIFAGANRNVNISEDGVGGPGKGEKRVITGEFFRFLYMLYILIFCIADVCIREQLGDRQPHRVPFQLLRCHFGKLQPRAGALLILR